MRIYKSKKDECYLLEHGDDIKNIIHFLNLGIMPPLKI